MNNAYGWYGTSRNADESTRRRPSQRRRLTVDRKSFGFYHNFMGFPKVTVGEIAGYALGGGFEMALMTDISVIARDTKIGMPATRFLGPALGSLHMFFHRLGPVLARRLLLTGDIIDAGQVEHLGIFTDTCDPAAVTARARYWAEKAAKMPADGVVIAKEAFRLVEQSQAYQGEEVASYLFHAFGTNLQFARGVQLRQDPRRARRQGSVPASRRALPRAGTRSVTSLFGNGQRFAGALVRPRAADDLAGLRCRDGPALAPLPSSISRLAWSRMQVSPYSKLVSSGAPMR